MSIVGRNAARKILVVGVALAASMPAVAFAQDAGCSTTPAESVGRLLDSLGSLFSTISRALPPPAAPAPPSDADRARAAAAALREHSERNTHRLYEEMAPALAGQEATAVVNRRNKITTAMRVEVRMSGAALRELVETGKFRATGSGAGLGLDSPIVRGVLVWSERAPTLRAPEPGADVIVTLKTDAIRDRALVSAASLESFGSDRRRFESSVLAWSDAPALALHRTFVGPRGLPPEVSVLGTLGAGDIASISLPSSGASWSGVESEIGRRLPGVAVTRYERP